MIISNKCLKGKYKLVQKRIQCNFKVNQLEMLHKNR
jgi:hypothetical protein